MTKKELEAFDDGYQQGREHERVANHICRPDCQVAACVNGRLREALRSFVNLSDGKEPLVIRHANAMIEGRAALGLTPQGSSAQDGES